MTFCDVARDRLEAAHACEVRSVMECKGVFLARKEALDHLELKLNNTASLLSRNFMSCESAGKYSGERTSEFRVMQWNILADGKTYTHAHHYIFDREYNLNV